MPPKVFPLILNLWAPGSNNITGNERADALAEAATTHLAIPLESPISTTAHRIMDSRVAQPTPALKCISPRQRVCIANTSPTHPATYVACFHERVLQQTCFNRRLFLSVRGANPIARPHPHLPNTWKSTPFPKDASEDLVTSDILGTKYSVEALIEFLRTTTFKKQPSTHPKYFQRNIYYFNTPPLF